MTEVVRYFAARVRVPPPRLCDRVGCDSGLPLRAHVVGFVNNGTGLSMADACARCAFVLQGVPGLLWFPYGAAPPLEVIGQAVESEMARRRPPQPMWSQTYVQTGGYGYGTTTAGNGGFFIRFG